MPPPKLDDIRLEYNRLWSSMQIRAEKLAAIDATVAVIMKGRARYGITSETAGVPWHFIAVVHSLEASCNFKTHLHNGDPLTARTRNVPAGRPSKGRPPFTWEDSAVDALGIKGLSLKTDWTPAGTLYQLERYNGFGYRMRHPETLSPYLWSWSTHYGPPESPAGKYVADGKWSSTAVSKQCGAAVLLKRMHAKGLFVWDTF